MQRLCILFAGRQFAFHLFLQRRCTELYTLHSCFMIDIPYFMNAYIYFVARHLIHIVPDSSCSIKDDHRNRGRCDYSLLVTRPHGSARHHSFHILVGESGFEPKSPGYEPDELTIALFPCLSMIPLQNSSVLIASTKNTPLYLPIRSGIF